MELFRWRYAYTVLTLCWLAWFMNFLIRMIVPPLLPLIKEDFQLTYTQIGLIATSFYLTYALMQIPSGILADRINRKWIIAPGIICFSIGTFLTGFAGNLGQIILFQALTGLGAGVYFAAGMSLITSYFHHSKRGKVLGIHDSAAPAGSILGPTFAGLLAATINWRAPFFACLIPGLVVGTLFWIFIKDPAVNKQQPRLESRMRAVLKRSFLTLLLVYIIGDVCYCGAITFIPTYLIEEGKISLETAGMLTSILFIAGLFGMVVLGSASDKFGRNAVIAASLLSAAIFTSAIVMITIPFLLALVLICFGFSLYGYFPVMSALLADLISEDKRGTAFGIVNAAGTAIGAVTPALVGYTIDVIGWKFAFLSLSAIVVLGAILASRTKNTAG
ncbi:MFS transporter [Candidatus Bathyarchaeota archaeon]|nr:MFS transporter [Candidatus Bathyarchaeota archaeon]